MEIPCECGTKNPFLPTNCGTFNLEERIGVDAAFVNCVIRKSLFPPAIMPHSTVLDTTQKSNSLGGLKV